MAVRVLEVSHLVDHEDFKRSVAMQAPAQRRFAVVRGQFPEHLAGGKECRVPPRIS
jgi:hypothetical protein